MHASKAGGEEWLRLRVFLTLVLDGSEWSVFIPWSFYPGKTLPLIPTVQEARSVPEPVWKLYWELSVISSTGSRTTCSSCPVYCNKWWLRENIIPQTVT
jgi:aldehyde:ferredoxin oxidoreductase